MSACLYTQLISFGFIFCWDGSTPGGRGTREWEKKAWVRVWGARLIEFVRCMYPDFHINFDVKMSVWSRDKIGQNKADHVVSISKHAPADGCHIWINYEDVESVCISAILLLTILGLLQYITPLLPLFQATISRNVKLNYSFCEK